MKQDQRGDHSSSDPIYLELQSRLTLSSCGAAASLLAAALSAVFRLPQTIWIFLLLCSAICVYSGVRYAVPLKKRDYYTISAECVEKETWKLKRHYCKYYFDSEAGPFSLESSNRHKYYVHRKYRMIFSGKNLPLSGEYLLICDPVRERQKKSRNKFESPDTTESAGRKQ